MPAGRQYLLPLVLRLEVNSACMRTFVFVFATANLILDLLWRGSQIGDFDPEGFSAESHVTHRLLWAYGVCLLCSGLLCAHGNDKHGWQLAQILFKRSSCFDQY